MQYTTLGGTDLTVSRIGLGCMSIGEHVPGFNEWSLSESESRPVLRRALDLGITFWDTANIYGGGTSEEFIGRALTSLTTRDEIVLATKVYYPVGPAADDRGLSRRAINKQIDASLRRLQTDYIDLYQIHRFDPETPVEETLEALHELVEGGKVRYLGASSMHAWQFAKLQYTARANGWTPFISMQDHYSLLEREEEREMFGLLADEQVDSIVWSPLAQGRLARPFQTTTRRSEHDGFGKRFFGDGDEQIIRAAQEIAGERGVPMAQISMAWVFSNPVVAVALAGATAPHHLDDAVAALEITLTEDERSRLESAYRPRSPIGY
ncbi:aldo/keto reductase [Microbacterium sp. GXF7504]